MGQAHALNTIRGGFLCPVGTLVLEDRNWRGFRWVFLLFLPLPLLCSFLLSWSFVSCALRSSRRISSVCLLKRRSRGW